MTQAPPQPGSAQDVQRPGLWPVVVVILLCCGVETALTLADRGILQIPRLRLTSYEYAGFWPGLLRGPWRPNYATQPWLMFCSYAFLHSGFLHLLVNMVTLWSLGRLVVHRTGAAGFILLYTAAVLGGGLGFGLLAQTTQPMVGASGGLFGLAGGILAWNYLDRFIAAENLWPVALWVIGLLVLNLVQWWAMDGLLAWQTHLGGFVIGWIAALLIDPRARAMDTDD